MASQVTNELPEQKYRQVSNAGYLSRKFCRSLISVVTPRNGRVRGSIPFLELPSLEDAIVFRSDAERVIQDVLNGDAGQVPQPPPEAIAPKGVWTSRLAPRYIQGKRPVLYQIVAVKGNALILEAKDFFVFMPDRRELHCVLLDRFAFNVENSTYGYDRNVISVRDFVWIYDLMPVASVLASPAADLERARLPRTAALDSNPTFFFRVARFAFVTPPVWQEMRYGIVLSVTRRGDGSAVNNFKMAMEDSPEAVTITRGLARFPWPHVQENEIMKALCRRKSSCAVRFSEPPASEAARDVLCSFVKLFLPANPDEAMLPMEVPGQAAWFEDRLGDFDSYSNDRVSATATMGKIFNAASSALASYNSRGRSPHALSHRYHT
ncbi:unnamed protein product [Heligmosomoides polygyrus]|uniref:M96 mating-specific protein family n=1 Tax=Heligmosomoides polygyrus TaxID=6339 RepID=A0A183FV80_HELPZ|nr:unnamed protein product [Heligmosomoides polygyrus]